MNLHSSTFEYLRPTDDQLARMARMRASFSAFASVLLAELPDGPDKTFIIRELRTLAMWANVSITRLPDGTPREDEKPAPTQKTNTLATERQHPPAP